MINVSKSLPDIAVLRGGKKEFKQSLLEGGEILASLSQIGHAPLDVLISPDGAWTLQGRPTDAHAIFSRAHTIIDATRGKNEEYHKLAKKMDIPLLFSQGNTMSLDREDVYRLLRQQGIKVPETITIRASEKLSDGALRDIWLRYHTPLIIRPLAKNKEAPSKLIKLFPDLEDTVRDYHAKGIDLHIFTYRKVPTSSVAILPHFHGQKLYTPVWVETFASTHSIPNPSSPIRAHMQAPQFRKEEVGDFVCKAYDALGLSGPACIDIIPYNNEYVVVNVDQSPSFRKDSRFTQSLLTTGATIGQYIHAHIMKDLQEK